MPLALLGEMVKGSLQAYELKLLSVETVQASHRPGEAEKIKAILRRHLTDFETKGNCLLQSDLLVSRA